MSDSQVRYSEAQRARFLDRVASGWSLTGAARLVGASNAQASRWWRKSGWMKTRATRSGGGIPGPDPSEGWERRRFLGWGERAVIQAGRGLGLSYAQIGAQIGRDRSVVFREVTRNAGTDGVYRARAAQMGAHARARRPKPFKLADPWLAGQVMQGLDMGWSPKLISLMLARVVEADQTRQVSHETIYQALYVQGRGHLRADLAQKLLTKRRQRVPVGRDRRPSSPYKEAFKISQRPAEVADRAVPGHWEGDLILGTGNRSAIGTLVERATRFTILLHLPDKHDADAVATAMIREMQHLPDHLRRSITWDRGPELANYDHIQVALNTKLFFCDPYSPWQRGTNENTNRLLRFWFEKGTDLRPYSPADLRRAQDLLNARPRPTLNLETPAMRLNQLLNQAA
jgi:IS30 family transposase